MRTVFDHRVGNCQPYSREGQNTPLVDKLIGNAYDVVLYVARYLEVIRYVAANMENIYEVAVNLKKSGLVLGQLDGVTGSVALPEGVTTAMILSSSVILEAPDGSIFGSDSGLFTASVQAGALRVFLKDTAPAPLQNAVIRWFITYGA